MLNPRDLIGYGQNPPILIGPIKLKLPCEFVTKHEEGGENSCIASGG